MMKTKKIIAVCLTALTFSAVTIPATLLTTPEVAYAQTYHKGALLMFSVTKVATNGGWYTAQNFDQKLTRSVGGYRDTYHLVNITYSTNSYGYHVSTANYSID